VTEKVAFSFGGLNSGSNELHFFPKASDGGLSAYWAHQKIHVNFHMITSCDICPPTGLERPHFQGL